MQRTDTSIDLNSSRLLPNGVTAYSWRVEVVNPITLGTFYIDMSGGVDCKSLEYVDLLTGKRTTIEREQLANQENRVQA